MCGGGSGTGSSSQVLQPLLAGRPARYQRWDWDSNAGAEWHEVPVGVPVVVEGVSSTDVRLGVPWDVTLWVDAPYEIRLARARQRDGPDLLDRWLTDWMPSEEAYAREQRPQERVDLIVAGSRPEHPGRPQLLELDVPALAATRAGAWIPSS